MAVDKNKNITRMEKFGAKGYAVRLMRKSKTVNRFFGDVKFGGKRKALASAREFRDEMIAKMRPYTRRQAARRPHVNNTSGIPGVRFVESTDPRGRKDHKYRYWVAQWSPAPGERKTARFSVATHGTRKAKQLAIKARERGVRQMEA